MGGGYSPPPAASVTAPTTPFSHSWIHPYNLVVRTLTSLPEGIQTDLSHGWPKFQTQAFLCGAHSILPAKAKLSYRYEFKIQLAVERASVSLVLKSSGHRACLYIH